MDTFWERFFFYALVTCGISLTLMFAVFVVVGIRGEFPDQVAYRQCVEDGAKPYVCYAMIYGGRK